MRQVEGDQGLVELEAVVNSGEPDTVSKHNTGDCVHVSPGAGDGEARDVRVEGDGHHVQRPGQAHHAQASVQTFYKHFLNIENCSVASTMGMWRQAVS